MIICPECGAGMHGQCIEQACECPCVLLDDPRQYIEAYDEEEGYIDEKE
jgi:hypothetical protein